ncbi:hypothetical protein SPHV1_410036 [Novosphingobium sp. KN65.2]|nr:hypothetical protein SPHV1_410036 [Novosphingobium sp. KN65.2]
MARIRFEPVHHWPYLAIAGPAQERLPPTNLSIRERPNHRTFVLSQQRAKAGTSMYLIASSIQSFEVESRPENCADELDYNLLVGRIPDSTCTERAGFLTDSEA